MAEGDFVLANPLKCRLIAEAQIKTDKFDALALAQLLRGGFIAPVHIPSRETRQRRECWLRQRCFFAKQRTRLRNRIHRLLGGFEDLALPRWPRQGDSKAARLRNAILLVRRLALIRSCI